VRVSLEVDDKQSSHAGGRCPFPLFHQFLGIVDDVLLGTPLQQMEERDLFAVCQLQLGQGFPAEKADGVVRVA
jgi:hypothetical protein